MDRKNNNKKKKNGQVFTPQYIVEEMLDYSEYYGPNIIDKHVIDNSCGDGAFLKEVVTRFCNEASKLNISTNEIKNKLETYIHGIDTDTSAFENCIENLNVIAKQYDICNVKWDIYNQSSLSMNKFNGKMDFVVGNPPYVRVHNLDSTYNEVKQYKFTDGGMTDLYLAFFELGFKMLNPTGKLCYISPSSWLNSVAGNKLRHYILKEKNLISLTDLGHFQAFEDATTYTIISLFSKDKNDKLFDYYEFDGKNHKRKYIDRISVNDCFIDGYFYLSDKKHLDLLRDIKTKKSIKYVSVKNGFATLADDVFIGNDIPKSNITIEILKASTGKWSYCLFPYDKKGKLLPRETIFSEPAVKEHFENHKNDLLKGKTDYPTYYEFGRTQAIADVWKDKFAINILLRTEDDIKLEEVGAGKGVYSGLYIVSNYNIPLDDIKHIIITKDFAKYISLLKKYKSGGYYTFNTKDIQQYINYYLTHKSNTKNYGQQSVSSNYPTLF